MTDRRVSRIESTEEQLLDPESPNGKLMIATCAEVAMAAAKSLADYIGCAPGLTRDSVFFAIKGQLVSMKNRRRILRNRRTGKPFSAKSEDAVQYVADFIVQVPHAYKSLKLGAVDKPLRATVTVYYTTMRPDLDTALIWDCLQAAGVIANDRYIIERHEYREVDAINPRVEIDIEEL